MNCEKEEQLHNQRVRAQFILLHRKASKFTAIYLRIGYRRQ